jgi:hypothetical protein
VLPALPAQDGTCATIENGSVNNKDGMCVVTCPYHSYVSDDHKACLWDNWSHDGLKYRINGERIEFPTAPEIVPVSSDASSFTFKLDDQWNAMKEYDHSLAVRVVVPPASGSGTSKVVWSSNADPSALTNIIKATGLQASTLYTAEVAVIVPVRGGNTKEVAKAERKFETCPIVENGRYEISESDIGANFGNNDWCRIWCNAGYRTHIGIRGKCQKFKKFLIKVVKLPNPNPIVVMKKIYPIIGGNTVLVKYEGENDNAESFLDIESGGHRYVTFYTDEAAYYEWTNGDLKEGGTMLTYTMPDDVELDGFKLFFISDNGKNYRPAMSVMLDRLNGEPEVEVYTEEARMAGTSEQANLNFPKKT